MRLALEGVAVWTRGLYADITLALKECGQRNEQARHSTLYLRETALADVNFWAYRLGKQILNGLPINDGGSEVLVTVQIHSDASDVGYGAHRGTEESQVSGELPVEVLGQSSTAREITGVMLAANQMIGELRGRRVRICMDSYPAIRNFINGGGSKQDLNALVKEWWVWCRMNRITPLYKWIPREENTLADDLSKIAATTIPIQPKVEQTIRKWLDKIGEPGMHQNQWLQTRVQCPVFDNIPLRLAEMRRARKPACIVVPLWPGRAWRADLLHLSEASLSLGHWKNVLSAASLRGAMEHANWVMEAHLIVPQ
jgi:hypothetical protein